MKSRCCVEKWFSGREWILQKFLIRGFGSFAVGRVAPLSAWVFLPDRLFFGAENEVGQTVNPAERDLKTRGRWIKATYQS